MREGLSLNKQKLTGFRLPISCSPISCLRQDYLSASINLNCGRIPGEKYLAESGGVRCLKG
jgi:hypothetical protein